MSARANAPIFHLHPSATNLNSPPPSQSAPIPPSHGFTPTNAAQLLPNPPPLPQTQHQQTPLPQAQSPAHSYHQRNESGSSQGRRRNSSFSRRRGEARSRSSVPPLLGPTLPQVHANSEADLLSGPATAPVPESQPAIKREEEPSRFVEPYLKRRREDEAAENLRPELERRQGGSRSPDRCSQRSGTGSVKSMRREEPGELRHTSNEPVPPAP